PSCAQQKMLPQISEMASEKQETILQKEYVNDWFSMSLPEDGWKEVISDGSISLYAPDSEESGTNITYSGVKMGKEIFGYTMNDWQDIYNKMYADSGVTVTVLSCEITDLSDCRAVNTYSEIQTNNSVLYLDVYDILALDGNVFELACVTNNKELLDIAYDPCLKTFKYVNM
ncbi:MAG: hypothetical protein RRY08_01160, partial [Christensenella sp.]